MWEREEKKQRTRPCHATALTIKLELAAWNCLEGDGHFLCSFTLATAIVIMY